MGIYVPGTGMLFGGEYPGTRITRLREIQQFLRQKTRWHKPEKQDLGTLSHIKKQDNHKHLLTSNFLSTSIHPKITFLTHPFNKYC